MRLPGRADAWMRWTAVVAVVVTLAAAWRLGWPRPLESVDEQQLRLDVAAPLPAGETALEQSFVSQHQGLTAIELLLVVYAPPDDAGGQPSAGPAVLTARLLDKDGLQLAVKRWDSSSLKHNQALRFSFEPQTRSAGQRYSLRLEGSAGNRATPWAFSLDGYPRGQLSVAGGPPSGDLRFQTIYRYRLPAALVDLANVLGSSSFLVIAASLALLLALPGVALTNWLGAVPPGVRDPAVRLGTAVAAGPAAVAMAWLWLSTLGGRWLGLALWAALAGLSLALVRQRPRPPRCVSWRWTAETGWLVVILAAGLGARLLAVRDLVLPAWVDSPQHHLISQMMADSGRVPSDYRPWMPVDSFDYHFGFHALAASIHQMTDQPVERIILLGGQVLNGLVPLSVYAAAVLVTGRRRAGLVAAFFVALLSVFPAYYVTWGRYTQLCGVLILPPWLGVAYRLFEAADRSGAGRSARQVVWLGLVVGGLFLVHARVWVFALLWLPVVVAGVWLFHGLRRARRQRPGQRRVCGRRFLLGDGQIKTARAVSGPISAGTLVGWLVLLLLVAGVSVLPWLVRVGRQVIVPWMGRVGQLTGLSGYNAIPWGYLTFGWERGWLALAGLGLLWAVWRRRWSVVLLGVWIAAVLAVLNSGLPTAFMVNNNSWVITLFVPSSLVLGWTVDDWLGLAQDVQVGGTAPRRQVLRIVVHGAWAAAVLWSGLFGLRQMVGIVNRETVLVYEDDLALIAWASQDLQGALVAVNSWLWLGSNNWAGTDGGYWLLPLTGIQTTMPPIGYGRDRENQLLVGEFNRGLSEIEDWGGEATLALFCQRGVTHLMIGQRGGPMRPESLLASENYQLVASNGAAWLFSVECRQDNPGGGS